MRSELGKITLDKTFEERESLNSAILTSINAAANSWGTEVLRYEIKDITPPASVKAAMDMQAEAERRKRADILASEGHAQAKINAAESNKRSAVLAAEGDAAAITARAGASATAVRALAEALSVPGGREAVSLRVAEQYVSAFGRSESQGGTTVLLPANAGDAAGMVAQAMSVFSTLAASRRAAAGSAGGGGGDSGRLGVPALPAEPLPAVGDDDAELRHAVDFADAIDAAAEAAAATADSASGAGAGAEGPDERRGRRRPRAAPTCSSLSRFEYWSECARCVLAHFRSVPVTGTASPGCARCCDARAVNVFLRGTPSGNHLRSGMNCCDVLLKVYFAKRRRPPARIRCAAHPRHVASSYRVQGARCAPCRGPAQRSSAGGCACESATSCPCGGFCGSRGSPTHCSWTRVCLLGHAWHDGSSHVLAHG